MSPSPRPLFTNSCITGIFLGSRPASTAPTVSTATASLPTKRVFVLTGKSPAPLQKQVPSITARSIPPIASKMPTRSEQKISILWNLTFFDVEMHPKRFFRILPLSKERRMCVSTKTLGLKSICDNFIFRQPSLTSSASPSSERLNGIILLLKSCFQTWSLSKPLPW